MSKLKKDIDDNEIRIIVSSGQKRRNFKKLWWVVLVFLIIVGLAFTLYYCGSAEPEPKTVVTTKEQPEIVVEKEVTYSTVAPDSSSGPAFVSKVDTIADGHPLTLLFPENSHPVLDIGAASFNDSTVVLITQAADIRADNGKIVGAFVKEGNVISKGKSKAGFCAIIESETIVGTAINTAYFEKATETGGYFFRQYPLVVEGQAIENKPKWQSTRKALAEINGKICVILSDEKLTLTDFALTLAELGVRNAIYLVGSKSYGFYKDADGKKTFFGHKSRRMPANANYIVWR